MNYSIKGLDGLVRALVLVAMLCAIGAHARNTDVDNGGVEVTNTGGVVMYRFRDASGKMIVQDTPPPHYFDGAAPAETQPPEEAVVRTVKKVAPPPPPEPFLSPLQRMIGWSLAALLALGAVILGLGPRVRRWLSENAVDRSLRTAGFTTFNNVKLTSGDSRHVTVDKIVRTPAGILVLIVEKLSGDIRGEAKSDHWATGTNVVPNPLRRLHQAAGIVENIAADVPVYGRVVDLGNARFATDMSPTIQKMTAFKSSLLGLSKQGPAPRALDGAWRTLMRFERSNNDATRVLGGGAVAWLKRNRNEFLAAMLMTLSVITLATTVYLQGL